ncbi:hypothetical protein OJ997_21860 [Solirubrobacter phytolaccae]|uniref:Calcium-binding protein n=1 Tax=Solirubrobacter phytolaccae TaxID=1404360 RepID=A0A9X3NBN4_9ACTN|nr:calcium-binding protein [Solirubrobacter phytolaccae]MDA0182971.1 hypothetical protein [Solirubrobacter phytolaccae]
MIRKLFAVGAALLVLAAPAHAAKVVNRGGTLTYTGSAQAEKTWVNASGTTVRVTNAPKLRERGCRARRGGVVCTRVKRIVMDLRGGADEPVVSSARIPAVVSGGAGADLLTAGPGDIELRGGAGDDVLVGTDRTRFRGGPGIDVARLPAAGPTFADGRLEDDVEDVLIGAQRSTPSGAVSLTGSDGPNHLTTGGGDDTLVGGRGSDVLSSGDGNDTVDARDGEPDRVVCGPGTDTVLADPVDQVSDTCERPDGDPGPLPPPADSLVNRDGTVTYTFGSAPTPWNLRPSVHVDLTRTPGTVSVTPSSMQVPVSVDGCVVAEREYQCPGVRTAVVIGGPGDDRITSRIPATLSGGPGDDELGSFASGQIDGGPGDDQLYPYAGTTVVGGGGIDTVNLRRRELDPLSLSFDGRADDGLRGEGNNVLADVEDVETDPPYESHDYHPDAGPRTMLGTDAANVLRGSYGDDAITGGKGRDELYGAGGNDRFDARDGEPDRIVCGPGNDVARVDPIDLVSATCERVVVRART